MQKIALIPAYCPEDRMIDLLKKLSELNFSVLVIDDGSGENYDAIFNKASQYADVKRYQNNRGKGEALKYGLRCIAEIFQPPYTVVTADADGQHRVEDIVRVSDTAIDNPDSLILGKRNLGKTAPVKSRIGNGITRVLYHLTTGRKIYETQTGLRAFSDRLLPRFLKLPGHRYEFEIDMILECADTEIIETEIKTVYFDNNAASHFRPFAETVSLNKEFLRYKLPSLTAGLAGYLLFVILATFMRSWLLPCVIARVCCILLKAILNKAISFSEKLPIGRYLITSAFVLICDVAMMWGLTALGMNIYLAKLLSSLLMIGASMIIRRLFMRKEYP